MEEGQQLAEMIVLDANILIRAVLGKRVRKLLETYAERGIRFYAPEIAYADAEKYLPALLTKREKPNDDLPATLAYLQSLIEPIGEEAYGLFEENARQRLRGRDEEDWPVLAAALVPVMCNLDGGYRLLWHRGCGLDFRSSGNLSQRAVQAR